MDKRNGLDINNEESYIDEECTAYIESNTGEIAELPRKSVDPLKIKGSN